MTFTPINVNYQLKQAIQDREVLCERVVSSNVSLALKGMNISSSTVRAFDEGRKISEAKTLKSITKQTGAPLNKTQESCVRAYNRITTLQNQFDGMEEHRRIAELTEKIDRLQKTLDQQSRDEGFDLV